MLHTKHNSIFRASQGIAYTDKSTAFQERRSGKRGMPSFGWKYIYFHIMYCVFLDLTYFQQMGKVIPQLFVFEVRRDLPKISNSETLAVVGG